MIKLMISILILGLLSGCSFKSKPNEWKYKSINAFSSYMKNFLSSDEALAKSDLSRAIEHAKSSADLTQLSRIYLGECALNISVGIDDKCKNYKELSDLVNDKSLESYYLFIRSNIGQNDLLTLDSNYRNFSEYMIKKEYEKAKKELLNMDKISSKLLAASLIKDQLNFDEVDELIKSASFYGYKKSVIFWLKVQKSKTTLESVKKAIDKKIKILG